MNAPRVEEVDAQTAPDDQLLAIHRIEEASGESRSFDEALGFMRHPPSDERRLHWLAYDGDEPVGMARLNVLEGSSFAWLYLHVLPQRRRRGAGRALLRAALLAAVGRALAGHHSSEDGAAFAKAVGARDEQRAVRSELVLRGAACVAVSVPHGYVLRSWVDRAPDELVESFAEARNALADAPLLEGQHEPAWTVARVRDLEAAVARRGRQTRVTAAIAGNEVVAFTELRVSAPPARIASTEDTVTLRAHRGRGLAQAVKAESLRLLRANRPDVEAVATLNAESNGPMRAVNAKLGFVPVATLTTAVLPPAGG